MSERDKFLTEAIYGPRSPSPEHWTCGAEYALGLDHLVCPLCEQGYFSDWAGFGKLWEWMQEQPWWLDFQFGDWMYSYDIEKFHVTEMEYFIHPDRLADAIYAFLRRRQL